ncbi:50S ribosomal protein L11 methyltransferase [soil metagenome]
MMREKKNNWFAVEIETETEAEEAVEFALDELDSLGNEINHLGKKPTENLHIIGYFNEKIDNEILREKLNQSLQIYGFSSDAVKKIEWREVENVDWLAEWKKHWKPTETEKFIIAPTWEKVENTEKIVIYIEPNMAFGTGTHETTKLCLRAIGEHFQGEMSFLDVGTGTGILAIAAAKLKSRVESRKARVRDSKFEIQSPKSKVKNHSTLDSRLSTLDSFQGCDTDVDSIKIAKENAAFNNVKDIEFYVGSISDETPEFDFVCANLTADVILPMLELLVQKTRKILVLSGILKEQESLVVEKLQKLGISDFKVQTDGEWISILMKKHNEN